MRSCAPLKKNYTDNILNSVMMMMMILGVPSSDDEVFLVRNRKRGRIVTSVLGVEYSNTGK